MPKRREFRCAYRVPPGFASEHHVVRCSEERDPELKHACTVHADLIREMRA